ncbi:hypothetical protein CMI37_26265 [Candidatus Pacearchaeota archaeon]|nr:hypothetical protein [Candidatus Pacearchaeota archaeon]|tara:strand:- start:606 stop:1028 length:423 start_codon:yes stop_codon:yes gene_type:complete
MVKRCIYCSGEISDVDSIDVCRRCGIGVWGEKMFNAIVAGMNTEKEKGNLELGRVGEEELEVLRKQELTPETFVEKELISAHHETKSVDELDISPKPIAFIEEVEIREQNRNVENSVVESEPEGFPESEIGPDFSTPAFN